MRFFHLAGCPAVCVFSAVNYLSWSWRQPRSEARDGQRPRDRALLRMSGAVQSRLSRTMPNLVRSFLCRFVSRAGVRQDRRQPPWLANQPKKLKDSHRARRPRRMADSNGLHTSQDDYGTENLPRTEEGRWRWYSGICAAKSPDRLFCPASGGFGRDQIRGYLGLVDLSQTPNGAFFREVHPVSEMGCKHR